MKVLVFLIFGQVTLNLASEPITVLETPANCTKIDKASLQKKVTTSMEKVIEQLFQDASFFRKKRSEKEQHTVFLDTVVPQELEREHQRVENIPKSKRRAIHYQYVSSWKNNAYANADYKKTKNRYEDANDLNIEVAEAHGGNSAYASASSRALWRSKRFCVPLSYDDGVKKMVKKVVDETFKKIEL